MPAPCRKCGATKTEPVRHGLIYHLVRVFGYRLRRCSRCRWLRALPRSSFRPVGSPPGEGFDPDAFTGCPRCGSRDYARAGRNWAESMLNRAPMARCKDCGRRFTYPQA